MKRSEIKRRPLADTVLASLAPEAKEYRELDGDGLYFRVKPDGSKSWQLRYKKADGKWSWLVLAGYGTVDHRLTGEQARGEVRKLRNNTSKDSSIMTSKRANPRAEPESANNTFEHLAREWYAAKCKSWSEGTAFRTIGVLEMHVYAIFGRLPYSGIMPMEWME